MRDSRVEWMDRLPETWTVPKIRYVCQIGYGDSLPSESRNQDGDIPVYGSNGVVGYHDVPVTVGETVIIGRKGSFGKINYERGPCFPIDTTFFVDQNLTEHDVRWLFYSLQVLGLDHTTKDSTIPGINREEIYDRYIPLPPLPEQREIVSFLDEKTSLIDEIIEKKTKRIELLKELRSSLISEVVTKGLDPDVEMKDSGVEWIGEIPVGWDVVRTKHVSSNLDGKRVPLSSEERGLQESKVYPYWGSNGVIDYVEDFLFEGEHVLVGEDGSPFFDPLKDVSFYVDERVWVNNHIHILRPNPSRVLGRYLVHSFNIVDYSGFISGTTRDKLTQGQLNDIRHPVPPLPEQREIVSYLDTETSRIDGQLDLEQKTVTLLKELRQSLISEVVTGKIDVRKERGDEVH